MKKIFASYVIFCFVSLVNAQTTFHLAKPESFSTKKFEFLNYKPSSLSISEDALCRLTDYTTYRPFEFIDNLVSYSKKFLGVRYRYAGSSPYGFDCSGFTSFVYSKFGLPLARSAPAQASLSIDIERGEAQKGDLIFFKGRNWRSDSIGHVGLIISNENGKITFIHASVCCGIIIESTDVQYYAVRYIKVSRVVNPNS